jgi:hypothetical protein
MLEKRFILPADNGKSIAYIKIGDLDALKNMQKGEWWFRHPAYFQYEALVNGDKERGDDEDSLLKEQFSFEETTTQTINCL